MKSCQLAAQKMSKIKVKTVHLRGLAQKGGMRLGKIGWNAVFKNLPDSGVLKIALWYCIAHSGTQCRKAQQSADKPDRPVPRHLPGSPAPAPFLAQCRQRRFVKLWLRQQ